MVIPMGIHRIKIPDEHLDIIEDIMDSDGSDLVFKMLRREAKARHEKFWKAIKAVIPEIEDVEESLTYKHDTHEVYWID